LRLSISVGIVAFALWWVFGEHFKGPLLVGLGGGHGIDLNDVASSGLVIVAGWLIRPSVWRNRQ